MRIDVVLKFLCLVKSRSIAKTLCENDRVLIGSRSVRPSQHVAAGQRVTIHYRARTVTIELLEIPQKQLSKSSAVDYYRRADTPSEDTPDAFGTDGEDNWRDS